MFGQNSSESFGGNCIYTLQGRWLIMVLLIFLASTIWIYSLAYVCLKN